MWSFGMWRGQWWALLESGLLPRHLKLGGTRSALFAAVWNAALSVWLPWLLAAPEEDWLAAVKAPDNLGQLAFFAIAFILGHQRRPALQFRQQLTRQQQAETKLLAAERQRVEATLSERMHHADRLASIGTLAAGVAHEINNPLTYLTLNIATSLELLKSKSLHQTQKTELRSLLAEAADGAERVRRIVGNLKTFTRHETDQRGDSTDVAGAIRAAVKLASNRGLSSCWIWSRCRT